MFDINGKQVDLAKALPVTIGDLRELKKTGIEINNAEVMRDPDNLAAFLLHMTRKVDESVTEEDINSISIDRLTEMVNVLVPEDQIDRPT